jgi:serine/threonine-protein kinase ATR
LPIATVRSIFDKGLHLPRPEVVPFRLTPNIIDAFGPTGADGAFCGGLTASMQTLRDNKDVLLSVLEPFLKDPVIDWKRQRSQQKRNSLPQRESNDAKRSVRVIEQRLKGMYNLGNPNHKKVRQDKREGDYSFDQDDEMARLLPLSVEGQVHKMITEASSHENLVQLYFGWMPWL